MSRNAGWRAGGRAVHVGGRPINLVVVEGLEAFVDREALLSYGGSVEPPYWTHLWSGAVELARHVDMYVPCAGRRILEIGCGLGLVGIVASLKGGQVTFLDRDAGALDFAERGTALNGCSAVSFRQGDFTTDDLGHAFDLILGAEVLYDMTTWTGLARFIVRHLAPGGSAILADAHRTPTRGFYAALKEAACSHASERVVLREDGLPLDLDIVMVQGPPRNTTPAAVARG